MAAYNILEARNNLSRIIAAVESGAEEAVIMRRGKPVAKIVAADDSPADSLRPNAAIIDWLRANPLPQRLARSDDDLKTLIVELRGPAE